MTIYTDIADDHGKTCKEWDGYVMEDNVVLCKIDADKGQCVDHSIGYDEETLEIRCAGCDKVLWTKKEEVKVG